jgi:hypothetical protein
MFTHENILALHSNPLGVMCQSFFRCVAARVLSLGRKTGLGVGPLSRFPVLLRPEALTGLSVLLFPIPLRAPVQCSRNFRRFGLTPCAAALSVEGSRLARRPPRKRRVAAFTPRSETTIGTGLNSSERDDIQTMDRQVGRAVWLFRLRLLSGLRQRGIPLIRKVRV